MKSYIITTGVLFLLLTIIHVVRLVEERQLATDPWFLSITILSLALSAWALRLYRQTGRT